MLLAAIMPPSGRAHHSWGRPALTLFGVEASPCLRFTPSPSGVNKLPFVLPPHRRRERVGVRGLRLCSSFAQTSSGQVSAPSLATINSQLATLSSRPLTPAPLQSTPHAHPSAAYRAHPTDTSSA